MAVSYDPMKFQAPAFVLEKVRNTAPRRTSRIQLSGKAVGGRGAATATEFPDVALVRYWKMKRPGVAAIMMLRLSGMTVVSKPLFNRAISPALALTSVFKSDSTLTAKSKSPTTGL